MEFERCKGTALLEFSWPAVITVACDDYGGQEIILAPEGWDPGPASKRPPIVFFARELAAIAAFGATPEERRQLRDHLYSLKLNFGSLHTSLEPRLPDSAPRFPIVVEWTGQEVKESCPALDAAWQTWDEKKREVYGKARAFCLWIMRADAKRPTLRHRELAAAWAASVVEEARSSGTADGHSSRV
jgi:hypothetical protein